MNKKSTITIPWKIWKPTEVWKGIDYYLHVLNWSLGEVTLTSEVRQNWGKGKVKYSKTHSCNQLSESELRSTCSFQTCTATTVGSSIQRGSQEFVHIHMVKKSSADSSYACQSVHSTTVSVSTEQGWGLTWAVPSLRWATDPRSWVILVIKESV